MKIADLMRHESIGTLFGWMWIIGCFSAVYFFVQAYMYQDASSWIPFLLALGPEYCSVVTSACPIPFFVLVIIAE